jgi:mono/diheme cytochrome c family protein
MSDTSTGCQLGAAALVFLAPNLWGQTPPGDTYFSLAVTENSHNHTGAKRLFLDFQEPPFSAADPSLGEVVSVRVSPGAVQLDGSDSEWDLTYLTTVHGLPQNNYPLSEFIDSVRTDLLVGSAWDATHVYLIVQWEDAGYDSSARYQKWIYGDQGGGETGWNKQVHIGATSGAPNAAAPNATGHILSGAENEDRVFFMFPITDFEGNFTPTGAGCALYCHSNLETDYPWQNYTGDGVVAMHTNIVGDTADIWHWKSSRTEPSGYVDDKYIEYAIGSANGRKSDAGTAAYSSNNLLGGDPMWMHQSGLSYTGNVLYDYDAVPFSGTPAPGDEIPAILGVQPSGSRGDVQTAASFDPTTKRWTVEFKRLRDTGNADDHSFEDPQAPAPTLALIPTVDVVAGTIEYNNNCLVCHDTDGVGTPVGDGWVFPRVQRTTGSLIYKAVRDVPSMTWLEPVLSEQQIEDIAAYLQTLAVFEPTWTLTATVVGVTGTSVVTSDPLGIDCPGDCTAGFLNGTQITLTANPVAGSVFTGWSGGPCGGTGDCSFIITADTSVIATYEADCNGNGVPDDQDISGGTSLDVNGNGLPDDCECLSSHYCSTSPNSVGAGALIDFSGSLSVTLNNTVLGVTGAPPGRFGLFYYGSQAQSTPLGNGVRCVDGALFRLLPPQLIGPAGSLDRPLDLTQPPANSGGGAITPGSQWYFQFWYRDPAGGGARFNLSDALDLVFCP